MRRTIKLTDWEGSGGRSLLLVLGLEFWAIRCGAISAIDFDGKDKSTWQISHSISTCRRAAERAG